jgi:hypothetical protein
MHIPTTGARPQRLGSWPCALRGSWDGRERDVLRRLSREGPCSALWLRLTPPPSAPATPQPARLRTVEGESVPVSGNGDARGCLLLPLRIPSGSLLLPPRLKLLGRHRDHAIGVLPSDAQAPCGVTATPQEKSKTQAEKDQERRKEAESIRVANGGKPAQQRAYSAPVPQRPPPTQRAPLQTTIGGPRGRTATIPSRPTDAEGGPRPTRGIEGGAARPPEPRA